jgi:hypothetical protein
MNVFWKGKNDFLPLILLLAACGGNKTANCRYEIAALMPLLVVVIGKRFRRLRNKG